MHTNSASFFNGPHGEEKEISSQTKTLTDHLLDKKSEIWGFVSKKNSMLILDFDGLISSLRMHESSLIKFELAKYILKQHDLLDESEINKLQSINDLTNHQHGQRILSHLLEILKNSGFTKENNKELFYDSKDNERNLGDLITTITREVSMRASSIRESRHQASTVINNQVLHALIKIYSLANANQKPVLFLTSRSTQGSNTAYQHLCQLAKDNDTFAHVTKENQQYQPDQGQLSDYLTIELPKQHSTDQAINDGLARTENAKSFAYHCNQQGIRVISANNSAKTIAATRLHCAWIDKQLASTDNPDLLPLFAKIKQDIQSVIHVKHVQALLPKLQIFSEKLTLELPQLMDDDLQNIDDFAIYGEGHAFHVAALSVGNEQEGTTLEIEEIIAEHLQHLAANKPKTTLARAMLAILQSSTTDKSSSPTARITP